MTEIQEVMHQEVFSGSVPVLFLLLGCLVLCYVWSWTLEKEAQYLEAFTKSQTDHRMADSWLTHGHCDDKGQTPAFGDMTDESQRSPS